MPVEKAVPPSEEASRPPQQRSAWAETFYSFRYRDFRLLWFSTCCIAGGTWFMQVTLGWLAWEMTRDALQDEFVAIHRTLGLTTVMVTHDMTEALLLADRIAVMLSGRVLRLGTPHELLTDPGEEYVQQLMHTPKHQAERLEELIAEAPPAAAEAEP
jgi:hypothetical protein